ncbi:hypothetical protein O6H91_04G131800 [Diphasiastrum complanatum]|uniref:Uncharacterized protein n=2 Tax=Diphasiastrum complanatum TaxID=34168 RepID=A0ACC2E243_DIPCM|nr:hypothetical protein O6H91_04G131500 [Diphasiastrum complanatum]KAJ7560482.1 hypothetical protein O6H91_04G131800 [Diphasiastrum complanatum]
MANHGALQRSILVVFVFFSFVLLCAHAGSSELGSSNSSFIAEIGKPLLAKSCHSGDIEDCDLQAEELASSWGRRRLLQQSGPYYISYGSLTADRTPCPPMSGRSYYTSNCNSASGPVDPYERGCSAITRCARDSS